MEMPKNLMGPRSRTFTPNLVDEFLSDFDQMFDHWVKNKTPSQVHFYPACDINETDTHFLVSLDVPGLKKDDIKIEVNDNQLLVHGERKREVKKEQGEWHRHERSYGQFQRTLVLPRTIDSDKIEAQYEDGVLNIALPKTEAAKGHKIEIQSGKKKGIFSELTGSSGKKGDDHTQRKSEKVS